VGDLPKKEATPEKNFVNQQNRRLDNLPRDGDKRKNQTEEKSGRENNSLYAPHQLAGDKNESGRSGELGR